MKVIRDTMKSRTTVKDWSVRKGKGRGVVIVCAKIPAGHLLSPGGQVRGHEVLVRRTDRQGGK